MATTMVSIQGERQQHLQETPLMELSEVDRYVDSVSEEVLACRERGRHLFPSIRAAGIQFVDVTDDGLLVRRLLCQCCRLAERVEYWEATERGAKTRYAPVSATNNYLVGSDGERYLGPRGRGRMTSKMIRNSLASSALQGQTVTMVRNAAKKQAAQNTTGRAAGKH